jgi:hypothetical protein
MTDKVRYHEVHSDSDEINFINNIGIDRPLDDKEIIHILEGYISGAKHKDWDRCGLTEGKCMRAAQNRLKEINNKVLL